MSSIFEAYDSEFSAINKEITKNINELKNDEEDNGPSIIKQIDALFSQANDLIKQMEVEARSHDVATRKILTEKLAQYKKSTGTLKVDFGRAKEQAQRSSLIGSKSMEHRQRLLDSHDKINRQNELIANAHRTVAETEEVGMEITSELARNREKIESSRAKAHEFIGLTDTARRILANMSKREVRQKYTLAVIAAMLIVSIIITVYYSTAGK